MQKTTNRLYKVLTNTSKLFFLFIFILGIILTFASVNPLTKLFFTGKGFYGRNLIFQIGFFSICTLCYVIILFVIGSLIKLLDRISIQANSKFIYIFSIIYFYLSIYIFVIGWTRLIIAIPSIIMISISLFLFIRSWVNYSRTPDLEPIKIKFSTLVFVLLFFAVILYCYGYSGHSKQASDWYKDNVILSDLMNRSWPIYYQNNGEHSMLTYYLGQFVVPGFIGKLFHLSFNFAAQIFGIWCYLGYLLVYLGFIRIVKASTPVKQILCAVIFVFFDGLLILAQFVGSQISPQEVIKPLLSENMFINPSDKLFLLYTSNTMAIQWLPQQCIVPWLIICLFFERHDDIASYVPLALPMVFYSGIIFACFLPFLFFAAIIKVIKSNHKSNILRQIFSLQNCLLLASFGIVILAYFWGYIQLEKPASIAFHISTYWFDYPLLYLCFCFFVFGLDSLLAKKILHNPPSYIFWCMVIILSILPFFHMGYYNDLAARGSIPSLFILMIFITMGLFSSTRRKLEIIYKLLLIFCVVIGMIYPTLTLIRNIKNVTFLNKPPTFALYTSVHILENSANRYDENIDIDWRYNSYTYDVEESIFHKYFASKSFPQE